VYGAGGHVRPKFALLTAIIIAFAALPAAAHHSLSAEYDLNRTIMLKGTVTKIAWGNPHARLYIDVQDAASGVMSWEFVMASPNMLMLNGWKIDTLRRGDHVLVYAHPARHSENVGYANRVTTASR
jgi:hypothetical protein